MTVAEQVDRLEREHGIAIDALRRIRSNSITHDNALAMAEGALAELGVVPQPRFEALLREIVDEEFASFPSLSEGMAQFARSEAITERIVVERHGDDER